MVGRLSEVIVLLADRRAGVQHEAAQPAVRGLRLETAFVGLALSAGPLVAALTGVPAGRIVDRFGAQRMAIAVGSRALSRRAIC